MLRLFATVLLATAGSAKLHFDVLRGANFPDPSILIYKGIAYAFATNDGDGHNLSVTSNPNFSNASGWSAITDAFPTANVPAFGNNGWAVEGKQCASTAYRCILLM